MSFYASAIEFRYVLMALTLRRTSRSCVTRLQIVCHGFSTQPHILSAAAWNPSKELCGQCRIFQLVLCVPKAILFSSLQNYFRILLAALTPARITRTEKRRMSGTHASTPPTYIQSGSTPFLPLNFIPVITMSCLHQHHPVLVPQY